MKQIIQSIFIILCVCGPAWGAVHYVDSDIENVAAGTGTLIDPYTSISSLSTAAGDTVYFKQGTKTKGKLTTGTGSLGNTLTYTGYKWGDITAVGSQTVTGCSFAHGVYTFEQGGKKYVAFGGAVSGLYIYDVTDPSSIVEKFTYDDDTNSSEMHGSYYSSTSDCLYVAGREGGLYIFDLTDLAAGTMDDADMINRIAPAGAVSGRKVTGVVADETNDILYCANRTGGWFGVPSAFSDAAGCVASAGIMDESVYETHRLDIALDPDGDGHDYLYCPNYRGLTIVDVSDLATPTIFKTCRLSYEVQDSWDIQVRGNYAYVTASHGYGNGNNYPGLYIYDVTDKYSPNLVGVWFSDTMGDGEAGVEPAPFDIVLSGNYAIIAWGEYGTKIIDISSPYSPTLYTTISIPSTSYNYISYDVHAYDDCIYVLYDEYPGDGTDVTAFYIYQVTPETDVRWNMDATRPVNDWTLDGTTDHLIDDYFTESIPYEYMTPSRNWSGGYISSNVSVTNSTENTNSTDGHLRIQINAGSQGGISRHIEQQTHYETEFKIAFDSSGPMGSSNYFYIYPFKYENPDNASDTLNSCYLVGDIQAGATTAKMKLRYYTDDSTSADTAYSAAFNLDGTFQTVKIIYKISTDVAGDEVEFYLNGAAVEQVDVDTSSVTKTPNLLRAYIYMVGSPAGSYPLIVDFDEFHYHNGTLDTSADSTLWKASNPGDDNNPNVIFRDGLRLSSVAKEGLDTITEYYLDTGTSPDTLYLYSSGNPDDSILVEAGYDTNSIEMGSNDIYILITKLIQKGARASGCAVIGGSNCANNTITFSMFMSNGGNGIVDTALGPINYYNVLTYNNSGDGFDINKQDTESSVMTNCIGYLNNLYELNLTLGGTGSLTHTYNCYWGGSDEDLNGSALSTGEIGVDPLFVDAANGNFRLGDSSPCIRTGTKASDVNLIGWQTDVFGDEYYFAPYDRMNIGAGQERSNADLRKIGGKLMYGNFALASTSRLALTWTNGQSMTWIDNSVITWTD